MEFKDDHVTETKGDYYHDCNLGDIQYQPGESAKCTEKLLTRGEIAMNERQTRVEYGHGGIENAVLDFVGVSIDGKCRDDIAHADDKCERRRRRSEDAIQQIA